MGNTEDKVKNLPSYSGSIKGSGCTVCVCTCTLEANSLKKFRARLVMWGSGSIRSTATSLTWPLTLSTSLSTNCVRTVTAICLTEGTSSLSLGEKRTWNYWLISATFSFIRMTGYYLLISTKHIIQLGVTVMLVALQIFGEKLNHKFSQLLF